MLNYAGPSIGPNGPIGKQLPPPMPGTMPSAVPNLGPSAPPVPPPIMAHRPSAPSGHPGVVGPTPPPAAALAAIMHAAANGGEPIAPPKPPEYGTTTQADGSILLHIKNPDGSLGPVVKLLPPLKTPGNNQPAQ